MKILHHVYRSYLDMKGSRGITYCILIGFLAFLLQFLWLLYFDLPLRLMKPPIYDGLFFAFLTLLHLSFQRKMHIGATNLSLIVLIIYAIAFFKFDAFGDVIRFSDVPLVPTLIGVLGFYDSIVLIVPVALVVLVFFLNFKIRLFSIVPLGVLVSALLMYGYQKSLPVDKYDAHKNSHTTAHAISYGQALGFTDDTFEYLFRMKHLAQYAGSPDNSKDGRFLIDQDVVIKPDRDVHVILIESLINPYLLDGYSFEPSPFGEQLGKWMEGASNVIAPVTGGRSPDSEFELLCGLGALLNWRETVFTALTADDVHCLPWHFSRNGWSTVATTPVSPYIFNVKSVYERLSFSKIMLQPDLRMDDLDGFTLSAKSLLKQNLALIEKLKEDGKFVFNYIFTTATHIPFALDPKKRPGIIRSAPYNLVATQYANALYYTFKALESFVSEVLALDPRALIIVLGDHAPYLGPGFEFSDEKQTLGLANFRIPLLILDGGVPSKKFGDIAMFDLPYVILDILTRGSYCQENRCLHNGRNLIRPLVDEAYVANRNLSDISHCVKDNSDLRACILAAKLSDEHRSRLYELVR